MLDEQYLTLKSCCCYSLREGCIAISISRLIISLLNLPKPCISLSRLVDDSLAQGDSIYNDEFFISITLILIAAANVVGSAILIAGVLKRHRSMMKMWVYFVVVFVVAHVYNMFKDQGPRNGVQFLLSAMDIVFVSYCASVIRCYYLSAEVSVGLQAQPSRCSDNLGADEEMLQNAAEREIAISDPRLWVAALNAET
ncbi:hypothetical protein C7M84_009898 [Penaeus vannamei]|uniref:Uncharacterized protein n=1 Tax=Penaeus vannamei TaxID=6689 RepID=A0A3R7SRE6_PENVA|nr:uncharacterized protein LOC113811741 isoform X1 [Penaeus vannamei]XP_027219342.1 uncharacterized protein LOC113811741 isoform X1 [Penaeus vannamei]XP_027219343.1 uncharacterized protein LOC113811741 isoform X1 [Penaeus vannamei]XP_027219344.1 uncharacterized protein LOC113811741 isoform X1 [Penaeus vannamei]ROT71767.1 hypothetical protein C7M84_009898 [Penaeus vannamei]